MDTLILKIRLMLLTWLHLRSQPGSVYFVKCFSYREIKKATDGFKRILENSSKGTTYRAKFQNGQAATIKEIRAYDDLDDEAFYGNVQLLGHLHHRHIASLSGYSRGHKRFLIYEDCERGSLKDHLSDPLKTPLNWRTRLQIAVGIAAALLSDVSLLSSAASEKTQPNSEEGSSRQSCNDSIFQLGLLILELITGQSSDNGGVDLVQWVQEALVPRSINKMIDPDLGSSYNPKELKGLLSVARLCIEALDKPPSYPSQVLRYLRTKVATIRT
ncbi:OLC1v1004797C1 [Oldenlandia corymbosa var. corymbosa]|uniref:OLC1v1004797C1 n=1 Tax=Oldenlandia corymbosa var. corymbosa TaxID=529605 RepID=A0AAV1DDV5_OLDCO|nr:OLC1v1004797C1 [Oldenlandia corymbosa var. corymbosa]